MDNRRQTSKALAQHFIDCAQLSWSSRRRSIGLSAEFPLPVLARALELTQLERRGRGPKLVPVRRNATDKPRARAPPRPIGERTPDPAASAPRDVVNEAFCWLST